MEFPVKVSVMEFGRAFYLVSWACTMHLVRAYYEVGETHEGLIRSGVIKEFMFKSVVFWAKAKAKKMQRKN